MKTTALTYPAHAIHFIDLSRLEARYRLLTASVLILIEARQISRVLKLTHKLNRLVRCFTRLDTHNQHLNLKLDMLLDRAWRERVLKELGGVRRLKLWEAAKARIEARIEAKIDAKGEALQPKQPHEHSHMSQPAWLYTDERRAESERLKAHVRRCDNATAHPRIFRDPVRTDFDGLFRLAPLPRGERAARSTRIYTAQTISDYHWNNMLLLQPKGFGPAPVWPKEFYAAAKVEKMAELELVKNSETEFEQALASEVAKEPRIKPKARLRKYRHVPVVSPRDMLSPKAAYDLLDSPLS